MSSIFWKDQHIHSIQEYLTGSPPHEVLQYHNLPVPHNSLIMDIGVGFGYFIIEMQKYGNTLIAVDIVPEALDRVKGLCSTYLVEDIGNAPPVDLAICHLVLQHCSDNMILHIFTNLNLKENGIFSFQFAVHEDDSLNYDDVSDVAEGVIDVARSLSRMKYLIDISGLEIVELSSIIKWPAVNNVGWQMVKARRKR